MMVYLQDDMISDQPEHEDTEAEVRYWRQRLSRSLPLLSTRED
jgi:hypothetical protein